MNGHAEWLNRLNSLSGTIVSAGTETIQLYSFNGRLKNAVLVVSEAHTWIDIWRRQGIKVFCLEEHTAQPETNTGKLLQNSKTLAFLKQCPQPVHILMFKPDAQTSQVLENAGHNVLGCSPAIARPLENKLLFPSIAEESGVSIPETMHIVPDSSGHLPEPLLSGEMKFPVICQFSKGFSGNRTFLIQSETDWIRLSARFHGRSCRISRCVDGDTWTVNGCIFRDGPVILSQPFLQETIAWNMNDGLPDRIGSAGNRWGNVPETITAHVNAMALPIGRVLCQKGFFGFFGLDILYENQTGQWYAIEVNPRITASTPVLTPFEMTGDSPPLIAAHIAASAGMDGFLTPPAPPPAGGQRIYRHGGLVPPKCFDPCKNGIYRLTENGLDKYRMSANPAELNDNEILVWKPVRSGVSAEIMRIVYRGNTFEKMF